MERILPEELEEYKKLAAQALITEMNSRFFEKRFRDFSFKGREIGYTRRGWFPSILGVTSVTFGTRAELYQVAGLIERLSGGDYACTVISDDPMRLECKRVAPGG